MCMDRNFLTVSFFKKKKNFPIKYHDIINKNEQSTLRWRNAKFKSSNHEYREPSRRGFAVAQVL